MKAPWLCPVCGREVPSRVTTCDHGAEYRRGLEAAAAVCETWSEAQYSLRGWLPDEATEACAIRIRALIPPAQEQVQ